MRWRSFHHVGIALQVLEGPFAGSRFFRPYKPRDHVTAAGAVGRSISRTITVDALASSAETRFAAGFEQGRAVIGGPHRS